MALTPLTSACEELFTDPYDGGFLQLYTAHHATPNGQGTFPTRGTEDQPRIFDNDLGWTVTLVEGYVVTKAAALQICGADYYRLDPRYGPFPEDMRWEDVKAVVLAEHDIGPGDYCELQIQYGNFHASESSLGDPPPPAVEGATVYLRGFAEQADRGRVDFEYRYAAPEATGVVAVVDISAIEDDGGPLRMEAAATGARLVTAHKTYDRFLDGVAFDAMSPGELARMLDVNVPDLLRAETRASLGDGARPY